MAYACPVCGEPQVDAVHLADHLAFTAIAGDDDHESWLEETVGEWSDRSREDLAEAVVDQAEETEFPIDVDDEDIGRAREQGHDHAHGGVDGYSGGVRGAQGPPAADAETADDEAVEDVLAEAREYTRRMHGGDGSGDDSDVESTGEESDGDDEGEDGDESADDEDGDASADNAAGDDSESSAGDASDNETE